MISDPIFKRDSTGKVRTWQYEVQGDRWRTIAGLLDGQKVVSGWTTCFPKSQPTAEEQALFEAKAEETKKLERDYHRNIEDIDTPNYFKPMLAHKYEGDIKFPVFAQPKLDGIRCIATAKGLFSRQGKRIFGVPHIEEFLEPYFIKNPDLVLDGELYNHSLKDDFNKITSIVRKQQPTDEDLRVSASLIEYHVYDVPSHPGAFMERYWFLYKLLGAAHHTVLLVETVHVGTQNLLDHLFTDWVINGYEGQMIRINGSYEQKRSKNLLKRKEFLDEEFEVLAIEEGIGNWAGFAKRVICRLPDGRVFGAGVKGSQEFTRKLLEDRDHYVGKTATVRFFNYTPDGVPRFPVAVDFARPD